MIKRIITGSILAIFSLLALLVLPKLLFFCLSFLLFVVSLWEWCRLSGVKQTALKLIFYIVSVVSFFVIVTLSLKVQVLIYAITVMAWLLAFVAVISYPRSWVVKTLKCSMTLIGIYLLSVAFSAFVYLHTEYPKWLLVWVLFMVWGCDIGGLLVGKYWGVHKLATQVSPKKTVEGVVGSLLFCVLSTLALHPVVNLSIELSLFLSVLVVFFSVLGDLFESTLKRISGVKDSSNILPGHGGVLDRIDSLVAVLPMMAFCIYLIWGQQSL